jgi:hypothetical protein
MSVGQNVYKCPFSDIGQDAAYLSADHGIVNAKPFRKIRLENLAELADIFGGYIADRLLVAPDVAGNLRESIPNALFLNVFNAPYGHTAIDRNTLEFLEKGFAATAAPISPGRNRDANLAAPHGGISVGHCFSAVPVQTADHTAFRARLGFFGVLRLEEIAILIQSEALSCPARQIKNVHYC